MLLSKKQYDLLKQIRKKPIVNPELPVDGLDYLIDNKLAIGCAYGNESDPFIQYRITELGKAVLDERKAEKRRNVVDRIWDVLTSAIVSLLKLIGL